MTAQNLNSRILASRCYWIAPLFTFLGCLGHGSSAPPVILPPAADVDAIEVTPSFGRVRKSYRIDDPSRIRRLVDLINSGKSDWKKPTGTPPAGWYSVVLEKDGKTLAVLSPTSWFVGAYLESEPHQYDRQRSLTEAEWKELKEILEIPEPSEP